MKKTPYYVFFDVDGTLIKGKPMLNFLKFYYQQQGIKGKILYYYFILSTLILHLFGVSREYLNRYYYTCYKNADVNALAELGNRWFHQIIHQNNYYILSVIKELAFHQSKQAEIVLVSGSFNPCLAGFANHFGIKFILATSLEIINNRYTGLVLYPQTIGRGKVDAINLFLRTMHFNNFTTCFAYGDHMSDIPMLSLVGNPCVIAGDKILEKFAKRHAWKIIDNF